MGRSAKTSRRDPVTPRKSSRRRRSQCVEDVSSVSSAETQARVLPQRRGDEMLMEMGSVVWPLEELDYALPDYHSPASTDSSINTTCATMNSVGDDATRQLSVIELMQASGCAQRSPTSLDLGIPLSTSILDFGHLDTQTTLAAGGEFDHTARLSDGPSPGALPLLGNDWSPSSSQISRGFDLYFECVSIFVPFLHRPTFDASRVTRFLTLSMLCLAYQHGEDPDCGEEASSGKSLSLRCFQQARSLLSSEDETVEDSTLNIQMVQAYLLLEICALMYLCGKDSAYGLKMHPKMISLARSSGLMQPAPAGGAAATDLDSLWGEFVLQESQKRTAFVIHQIDALWYQLLSMPRSLSHLEIKHDLPCSLDCWNASSSAEWALRQLTTRDATSSVQYAEAVRRFLSPDSSDSDLGLLPKFDPYGAINIAQFLLSSAREVSGWSAITGRLSLDRLEPLRASLVALSPFIRPQTGREPTPSPSAALQESTWEIAMIELHIWSPSHTGGKIEGSVDAVLKEATVLACSSEISFGTETAQAAQPHVNWLLSYLDTTLTPNAEPPWISLYAYKAFLIAWQLVRKGVPGGMEVVGVQDGNVEGAIAWAREVFERRGHRRIGRLIVECLDMLRTC